jgi:hypothetical protein
MNITQELMKLRPELSAGSLKTYTSILQSIHQKVFGKDTEIEKSNFDKVDTILDYYKDLEPNKRKSILSALFVLTCKTEYRTNMINDIQIYNAEMKTHKKSDAEKENWVSKEEIQNIFNKLKANATRLYKNKVLSMDDLQDIQDFIIICLLGGIFIPPRRSLDYVNFKIKNVNVDNDNYLVKNELVYNSYKTSKFYDQQRVEIPKQLKTILTKWIKNNKTDYLLFDSNGNQMNSIKMTQHLNKIFGGKTSVNILRHTYLTDKFANHLNTKKELEEVCQDMGTSVATAEQIYIKK